MNNPQPQTSTMKHHMRNHLTMILGLAAAIAMPIPCAAQPAADARDAAAVKMTRVLTLHDALKIADAAQARAKQEAWTVAIAILDAGGHLLYFRRMDGTQIGSGGLAIDKADCSLMFKRPTKAFEDMVLQNGMVHLMNLKHVVAVEGGLPIVHDGEVIGAIGISGVTAEQDGIIAAAGLDAFK